MINEQREELLIARVAEGTANPDDWDVLFDAGPTEDTLWRRVAESQRDQAHLETLMSRADDVAERVVVPQPATEITDSRSPRRSRSRDLVRGSLRGHWGGWRAWTGWAVAAALIAAWSLSLAVDGKRTTRPASERDSQPLVASTSGARNANSPNDGKAIEGMIGRNAIAPIPVTPVSTQQAFQQYLERGQADGTVLGVVPRRVILETRPNPDGRGYELIYLQQIMERAVVPDLYQLEGLDERGRPGLVRYEQPPRREM